MLVGIAALLATSATSVAQTVNERLNRLEQKTDFYSIDKRRVKKTWRRQRADVDDAQAIACGFGSNQWTCEQPVSLVGDHPLDGKLWIKITANVSATAEINATTTARIGAGQCSNHTVLEGSGVRTYAIKLLCSGTANPQLGDAGHINIVFAPSNLANDIQLSLHSIVIDTQIISQVLTDFE